MAMIPGDYFERVYAGVLGKLIGVYVGRPFEGWTYDRILRELGPIDYYVHERLDKPLIVIDDDISGTFAFLRALGDYGCSRGLTPAQIGQSWLNYLIEKRTVLWWGGLGMSTEHTAYLRLKAGIQAPRSGSIELNGQVAAEQIGAQIFIDGWAMVAPGDPELAADLARRAASVSHDGEAVYAAQLLAAMESQAFVEPDMDALLDVGLEQIPSDCLIRRLIGDVRTWHAQYDSWEDTFAQVAGRYGYDKYGGNCHMVPNHAVVIMALLHCEDNFQKAMRIVNTAGWDTDCNSGNVGCLMGIKNGLVGLADGPDYRAPVADRAYIPTADGGSTVTDALQEASEVARMGTSLAGESWVAPKAGARYHFCLPGAVQGFVADDAADTRGTLVVENVPGHSELGSRSLALHYASVAPGRPARVLRETYPALVTSTGYQMVASPTLYPGQRLSARMEADGRNLQPVNVYPLVKAYGADDQLHIWRGPSTTLVPARAAEFAWVVDVPQGSLIAWVGLELASDTRADGTVYLDWLTWEGVPALQLARPMAGGTMWAEAWTLACDHLRTGQEGHDYTVIQNDGTGLAIQGTRDWQDYSVRAVVRPHLATRCGIAARVQGLKRYHALVLSNSGHVQLVRELDGTHVLAETDFPWSLYADTTLELSASGARLVATVNGQELCDLEDDTLASGSLGLLVEEGRVAFDQVAVVPLA